MAVAAQAAASAVAAALVVASAAAVAPAAGDSVVAAAAAETLQNQAQLTSPHALDAHETIERVDVMHRNPVCLLPPCGASSLVMSPNLIRRRVAGLVFHQDARLHRRVPRFAAGPGAVHNSGPGAGAVVEDVW